MSLEKMHALSVSLREAMPESDEPRQSRTSMSVPRGVLSPVRAPGLTRRGSSLPNGDVTQLVADYDEVRARYEELVRENERLKADSRKRVEASLRREQRYEKELEGLRDELRMHQQKQGGGTPMEKLRSTHRQVLEGVASLKQRTASVLAEQERDLLRAFRARLYDVQIELERERSKKDDGALEWIEKSRSLGKELDWSREEALRLDRSNQHLAAETARLKAQLKSYEADRELLVKQMLALKKENAKLKRKIEELEVAAAPAPSFLDPLGRSTGSLGALSVGRRDPLERPGSSRPSSAAMGVSENSEGSVSHQRLKELMARQAEAEARYREMTAKLKRLLEVERRNLRAVRAAHAKDLQSRTELEGLLRACSDDVRREIAFHRSGGKGIPPGGRPNSSAGREVSMASMTSADRERVLELLLSQERVVSLLYDKTFPNPVQSTMPTSPTANGNFESAADETEEFSEGDHLSP
eukprot:scaffold115589_cov26-Tisochrysis_lutea.AAC.1